MNLRKFTNLIRFSKNLTIGLSLTMSIVTIAFQVHGVSQQQKNHTRTSQAMTTNSQPIKPITIENTDKNGNPKTNLAISRDYQTLASGSPDSTIQIRNTITNQLIKTLTGHNGLVNFVSWSPDGKILASNASEEEGGTIKLWDTSTGKSLNIPSENQKTAITPLSFANANIAWNPNSKTFATTGRERIVKKVSGNSSAIAWSRDGKFIATTDVSRTIQIWDATAGKFVKSLTGHGSAVLDVVWSDDSKNLTSVSQDKTIKRWDISTGKEIETIGINLPHTGRVFWSSDGKKLAAGEWFNSTNNQRIQIWDISRKIHGKSVA
ncbi:WD40 repeat domain-containing protein [Calothrix sp. PCC 6303]|uniref:WD40 repeat domain-containing protein n=1 Tax=Calothrix sp. PCC 6303 TaxID=1170562 RepID=UPI0002A05311|nr:WD40 repeat-containing protein [Calothrix sp. PCC 6303]AFZ01494.1 WD40 repeat-containing protein [Calothrix sp. PCC 6303]